MPAAQPSVIVDSIIDAIHQSGASCGYVSEIDRTHPRKFVINYAGETFSLWVYIWTLTHGGRKTLPNEYRIQMTSVQSPLSLNPSGYTVLLGYYPDLGMFAGFDLQRHHTFTTGSPSVQINIGTIHEALQNGLAFSTKDNQEIAVGIRWDQFINYVLNSESFHKYGADSATLGLLKKAVESFEIKEEDIRGLDVDRQKIITKVSRYSRDANFRRKVLNAYENRCALTRIQLKLIEAAHILPVPSEGSSDHITNGIALSPTIHRAYDNCLIYLNEKYCMKLNEAKVAVLKSEHLDGGLPRFRRLLDRKIHLPADQSQWPRTEFIIEANKYRRISGYY